MKLVPKRNHPSNGSFSTPECLFCSKQDFGQTNMRVPRLLDRLVH